MGQWYDEIPDEAMADWILDQKIFFVATSPLSSQGHVNVSPKGRPSFHLEGKRACWYCDMTGSGNETLSHLYEPGNGRITIMFNAYDGLPKIVRLYGKGKVFERGSPEFEQLLPQGDERKLPGTRAIIWIDFHKVATSCGYSVPYYSYEGERLQLDEYYIKAEVSELDDGKVPKLVRQSWNWCNVASIDNMPGLRLVTDDKTAIPVPFKLPPKEQGDLLLRRRERLSNSPIPFGLSSLWALISLMSVLAFAAGYAAGTTEVHLPI